MAGRVPADVDCLAGGGDVPFSCLATNQHFEGIEYGAISWYAGRTLPRARTISGWLASIQDAADADLAKGRLGSPLKLSFSGQPTHELPGTPDSSGAGSSGDG